MRIRDESAEDFLIDIAEGKLFSFSRWSDGEWTCLLGRTSPANADGHPYHSDLRQSLERCLINRGPERLGMGAIARRIYGEKIDAWLTERGIDVDWYEADIFHSEQCHAAVADRTSSLVSMLRSERFRTIVVGPAPYESLGDVFPVHQFVKIPHRDCWRSYRDWGMEAFQVASSCGPGRLFVSVSAGLPGKVLVHDLTKALKDCGIEAWVVDLGSIWLSYLADGHGLKTRSYQRGWRPVV